MSYPMTSERKNKRIKKQNDLHKELAVDYDQRYEPYFSILFQNFWNTEILKKLVIPENSLVLDLGCGTGILLRKISSHDYRAVGLDVSHDMLQRAVHAHHVAEGDGRHLPFKDDSFDAVVVRGALHHIPDLSTVLIEINRVLKRSGQMVLSEPSNDSVIVRIARSILYRKNVHFDVEDEGFRTEHILSLLTGAGFSIKDKHRFGFLSYTFAGFPDVFPIMKYIPFNSIVTRIFIVIDRILAKLPIIKTSSLHIIITVEKDLTRLLSHR